MDIVATIIPIGFFCCWQIQYFADLIEQVDFLMRDQYDGKYAADVGLRAWYVRA